MKALERIVAEKLLKIKAVKLQPGNPFTWASGWKSPIYCDNRKTLSYPALRTFLKIELARTIVENFGEVEAVAGVATGAIAQGALVADLLGLPFVYIRSTPKNHGLENLIEGELKPGAKVVVIEDLISTGGSSLKAVEALRRSGCTVVGMVGEAPFPNKRRKMYFFGLRVLGCVRALRFTLLFLSNFFGRNSELWKSISIASKWATVFMVLLP